MIRFYSILGVCLVLAVGSTAAISWPMQPFDSSGHIGNSYGEFQDYGGLPYFHPGLDILAPAGTPVYAVKSGYVKAILTTSADLHWRVAIGDSAGAAECDGWLYAHLDQSSIIVIEGQWVNEGDYLGNLVSWPVADFHHLHFVKIRHSGTIWNSNWQFIGNPLDELDPIDDPDAPVFDNAFGSQLFAFSPNQSSDYFASGDDISGDVDIICKAWDYINHYDWKLTPYQIEYKIEGDSSLPWTNAICFTGTLDWSSNISIVYRDDAICDSRGDYDSRDYYFYLTNSDGDSTIETDDDKISWQTANFHNGQYTIFARAADRAGNQAIDSMTVSVANYFALSGTVSFDDGNPDLDGTIISATQNGALGASESTGDFLVGGIGGGTQLIEVTRPGYITADTVIMMNQDRSLALMLSPAEFVLGDANYSGEINLGDAVYIINYVFRDGPAPAPYASGDANSDGQANIGDAVFLINYIFRDGPPPQSRGTIADQLKSVILGQFEE